MATARQGLTSILAAALLASCTLVVDAGSLADGDATVKCAEDEKLCPDRDDPNGKICVQLSNANYGCSADTCSPCSLPHAQPRCSNQTGQCQISSCEGSYRDCDDSDGNGCEINIASDEANCGTCGNECSIDGGSSACAAGTCQVTFCYDDSADCDEKYSTGCEVDLLTNEAHCGACDTICSTSCSNGVCAPE